VWARDGAFSAMIMDAAGYTEEASLYLKWMSTVQRRDDGGFHTTYDWFTGKPVGFVEPQYDNAGAFLVIEIFVWEIDMMLTDGCVSTLYHHKRYGVLENSL
jgi:GH15 family glucan-1,4-alpha-glucosidase